MVDIEHLHGFTDGDLALDLELGALYLSSAETYLERLEASVDDPDGWRKAAHALKGASANLGAARVADLALGAEHGLPAQHQVRDLRAALEEVRVFFQQRGG